MLSVDCCILANAHGILFKRFQNVDTNLIFWFKEVFLF